MERTPTPGLWRYRAGRWLIGGRPQVASGGQAYGAHAEMRTLTVMCDTCSYLAPRSFPC